MHDKRTHHYWFIPGTVDQAKVHDQAYRKSILYPDEPQRVHNHGKGKCKLMDGCVTYTNGVQSSG